MNPNPDIQIPQGHVLRDGFFVPDDSQYCCECGHEAFECDYVECPNCGSGSIRAMYPDPPPNTYSGEFPYCP